MSAHDKWVAAPSPDYETNNDKLYPYSELPFLDKYNKLVMIPICIQNLLDHVDYFGDGKIEMDRGTSGFSDCYNINYEYKLVRFGKNKDRKIPNRIPLHSDEDTPMDTRKYIKDNSVLTVTLVLNNCTWSWSARNSMPQDIARIVNSDRGKVIIYGNEDERLIELITEELKLKQIFYCPIYTLPGNLQLSHWYTNYRAYLTAKELKGELYRNIKKGDIEAAIILTGCFTNKSYCCEAVGEVVDKLLKNNVENIIAYAYQLWNKNYKHVVCKSFQKIFEQILSGNCMASVNQQNNQMVLEPYTAKSCGDRQLLWKVIPMWEDNKIIFKLYNVRNNTYLTYTDGTFENAKYEAQDLKDMFHFKPSMIHGQVTFTISNSEYGKQLVLATDAISLEDKEAVGRNSDEEKEELCDDDFDYN